MTVVILKIVISLICSLLIWVMVAYRSQIEEIFTHKNVPQYLWFSWVATRILPFIAVFLVLDYTPLSDINGFFGQAIEALQGKVVYRDFSCMYSPLFPYLNAIALWFWYDKKAIVLLMILIEGLAIWSSLYFFGKTAKNYFLSLLYLLMPASLILCVLGGQEDVWLWLVLIVSYLVWKKTQRIEWFGVGLVIGFMLTKAVFVLIGGALLLLVPKSFRWGSVAVVLGLICFGILYYYTHWAWLEQPMNEAATLRAPNIISVLNPLTWGRIGAGTRMWNWVGLLTTVGISVRCAFELYKLKFKKAFSAVFIITYATMMIVQQSAYSNYIFIFLLPLTLFWIDFNNKKEVLILLIYNFLCVVHPSLWWRLDRPYYQTFTDILAKPLYVADYLMQMSIVLLTIYIIRLVWQKATLMT